MVGWMLFKVRDRLKESLGAVLLKPVLLLSLSSVLLLVHLHLRLFASRLSATASLSPKRELHQLQRSIAIHPQQPQQS